MTPCGSDFVVEGYFRDVYGITEHVGKIESLDRGREWRPPARQSRRRRGNRRADEVGRQHLRQRLLPHRRGILRRSFLRRSFRRDARRTSLGEKKAGDLVNLERPLAAGARLGGHFVQGHVDGAGRVTRLAPEGDNWWLSVRVPENLRRYVAEKGSIAIDGISLTVARWQRDGVADFAIIPFTYAHTNIRAMAPGDAVNLEVDILAKYVESLLDARKDARPRASPSAS